MINLESVQCQLNNSNASHLIIVLVVGSQLSPSLDVFIAIMKLANALLHQGNTAVQVMEKIHWRIPHHYLVTFVTRRHSFNSCANQKQRNSSAGYTLILKMQRLS